MRVVKWSARHCKSFSHTLSVHGFQDKGKHAHNGTLGWRILIGWIEQSVRALLRDKGRWCWQSIVQWQTKGFSPAQLKGIQSGAVEKKGS